MTRVGVSELGCLGLNVASVTFYLYDFGQVASCFLACFPHQYNKDNSSKWISNVACRLSELICVHWSTGGNLKVLLISLFI